MASVLVLALLVDAALAGVPCPRVPTGWSQEESSAPAWRWTLDWLEQQRDAMAADLKEAHRVLRARALVEDPAQAERLSPRPPEPRAFGYGILPEVRPDPPLRSVRPTEQSYSLEWLSTGFAADFRDAAVLRAHVRDARRAPLKALVDRYDRLRRRMRNLEEHLSYHTWWQQAVLDRREFFAERNRVMERVRRARKLREEGGGAIPLQELEAQIRSEVAPFRRTAGLAVRAGDGGRRVLPVEIRTDIEDPAFLAAFREGVEEAFERSPAAQARRFSVELCIRSVPSSSLYPEGPPAHGQHLDVSAHVARFPPGSLVLTTGARSTHAWQGRSILLGPDPVTRRSLAHEFGHLLGFADAYLRAYDGDPSDRFGVVLVEFKGLVDDLMGNPSAGQVTEQMIDELLQAYGSD